jgi:4-alpha-glucanotransferase
MTSLPSGKMDADAFKFIDFLECSGFQFWQMLPLGPPQSHGSPYDCRSSFAGNPNLIDISGLHSKKFPDDTSLWADAYNQFRNEKSNALEINHFQEFITDQSSWLGDYAIFTVLKSQRPVSWVNWPDEMRYREQSFLDRFVRENASLICGVYYQQYLFFQQWQALKTYAHQKGIALIGDLPFFVSHDSADCWSNQRQFLLDENGAPEYVAGVPPDYFSADGQRWGNPHYRWTAMENDGFHWWRKRLRHHLDLFDVIRIDHFRGFEACWRIPASEPTAINGDWTKTPGFSLFQHLQEDIPDPCIIAEDLGVITPEVETLRDHFGFPGMKILQFAFDGNSANPYLPHNHVRNSVVYTGTHDNNTTIGWFNDLGESQLNQVARYLGKSPEPHPWPLIRSALSSVASTAILPMQDLLGLPGLHRMNTPGTTEGNWKWRFQWCDLPEDTVEKLKEMNILYGRICR